MTIIESARKAIAGTDALLITAGAGMSVDSGLPDFRGNEGFWEAYPPIARLGLSFSEMAKSRWFNEDPAFAWGFTDTGCSFTGKHYRIRDSSFCWRLPGKSQAAIS